MSVDSTKYQTVLINKQRLEEVRQRIQKRTRIPIVKIVDFAIYKMMEGPNVEKEIMDWLELEESNGL